MFSWSSIHSSLTSRRQTFCRLWVEKQFPFFCNHGCISYCPSVAIKKSLRVFCRNSNVGRSSGLCLQHIIMMSQSSSGQLSGRGILYDLSRLLITSGLVIPDYEEENTATVSITDFFFLSLFLLQSNMFLSYLGRVSFHR